VVPQLGGDIWLRVNPPNHAVAHVQLDEECGEQLTPSERVSLIPRVEKTGEPHPSRRSRRLALAALREQPFALLAVFLVRDVAPLKPLPHSGELCVDAFSRSARPIGGSFGGHGESFGDSLALVVPTLKERHQLAAPCEQAFLADTLPAAVVAADAAAAVV